MISFDAQQMDRVQAQHEAGFIRAEVQAMAAYAAPLAESAGQAGMTAAVGQGLRAARQAGFAEPAQIRLYLQLMTSFGCQFGSDPQYEWLHPLLDAAQGAAGERARLAYWHSTLYLERVYGKGGVHGVAAGLRATELDIAALTAVGANLPQEGPHMLARMHPQRVRYLTASAVRALQDKAAHEADRRGLDGAAGPALLLALMFSFGHGVVDDPLHPWVGATLSDPALAGQAKTVALHARARERIAQLLAPTLEARS